MMALQLAHIQLETFWSCYIIKHLALQTWSNDSGYAVLKNKKNLYVTFTQNMLVTTLQRELIQVKLIIRSFYLNNHYVLLSIY